MISLTPGYGQYVKSGIEFVVSFSNGKVYLTDAEYCKLSGIPIGRVLDRLNEMQEGIDWQDIQIYPTHRKEGKKSVRLIPAETIFDWLLVDRRTVAGQLARDAGSPFAVYSCRLTGSTIHLLESVKLILETLERQKKDIELLKEQVKENAEKVKAQEIKNLRTQEAANRLAEMAAIKLTTNKECDDGVEDYYTVWQYLEDVGGNDSLNYAIRMNATAIDFCQNRGIKLKEVIRNRLGTVYAFPISVLKQLDKKRETVSDDNNEHYFTIPQYFEEVSKYEKPISLNDAMMINSTAFKTCKKEGIEIRAMIVAGLGTVNAFPVSILQRAEKDWRGGKKNDGSIFHTWRL
jgi:hypothetical protein